MSDGIKDKIVVITGASSGLGEATARRLSAAGAKIVLGARRTKHLDALAGELTGNGGSAIAITTDVTDREQVKALVDAAVSTYGRVDVMINNAGLMPQAPLERLKVEEWDRMIDVNIKGVLYGIAAVLSYMKGQKSGNIVNVSSVAVPQVGTGFPVYAAPGAFATELPNCVTNPATAERINKFYADVAVPADSFARAVAFAMSQPEDVDINEILFRPTRQEV